MKDNLSICPICNHKLTITKYECENCHTEFSGRFKIDNFARLSDEQIAFVELFVLKRGSIKEIEKELGISYPTVRSKLDDVIKTLGHTIEKDSSKIEILNMLNNGEISSQEATKLLSEL